MRRTRKKEYEKLIQKAKSQKQNVQLADYCMKYLNSGYDGAFDYVERMMMGSKIKDKREETIPVEFEKVYLEIAKHHSRNDEFDRALDILAEIGASGTRNIAIRKQVELEVGLIKVKRELEQGKVDQKAIEEVREIVKNDEHHEIETDKQGEFSDYDFVKSFFGTKIPVKDMGIEIFPENMSKPTGKPTTHRSRRNEDEKEKRMYNEELSAPNRLKFIMDNFDISCAYRGDGKLTGSLLFEMSDSDLVIIEKFYKQQGEQVIEDYGNATYIMSKDQAFDLVAMQQEGRFIPKKELRASKDERIQFVEHKGDYYKYLVQKYNIALGADARNVEMRNNPFDEKKAETEEKILEDRDDIEKTISDETEQETTEKKGEKDMEQIKGKKKSPLKIEEKSNEEFLVELNENLGGILPEQLMNAMLKDAKYSIQKIFNRLHKSIIESLRLTEVPEEKLEEEALKVFAYMRVTKQFASISNGAITKQEIPTIVDDSVLEYREGIDYMLQHGNDEGISCRKMARQIKEYFNELQEQRMSKIKQGKKEDTKKEVEIPEKQSEERIETDEEQVQDEQADETKTQEELEKGTTMQEQEQLSEDTIKLKKEEENSQENVQNEQQDEQEKDEKEGTIVVEARKFDRLKREATNWKAKKQERATELDKTNKLIAELEAEFETLKGKLATISPENISQAKAFIEEFTESGDRINQLYEVRDEQKQKLSHAEEQLGAIEEEMISVRQSIIDQMQI